MNDSKDMKVVFGGIIAIVAIAVLGVVISSYRTDVKGEFAFPTSTAEVVIDGTASTTGTVIAGNKGTTVKKVVITPEALALVTKIEKTAGLSFPITKQVFTFNFPGRSVKLSGYGFSYESASSSANKVAWEKINYYLSNNVNSSLSVLNSGSIDSKIRTYSSAKFICVAFERIATMDIFGPVTTSVRCAESDNIVK